jgi:hypothetical protein
MTKSGQCRWYMQRTTLVGIAVAVFALASTVPSHAAWVSFNGDRAEKGAALKTAGNLEAFSVEFGVPGLDISKDGQYVTVRIPGQPRIIQAGAPELPLLTTSLLLPDRGTPTVKLVAVEEKTIDLKDKVVPGRGHITRDIPLSSVPLVEGAAYKTDAFFPAADFGVELDEPYIARDVRGVAVRVSPVVYNPVKNQLRVLVKGRLEVSFTKAPGKNEKVRARNGIDSEFANIYKRVFVNYNMAGNFATPNENAGRAIVICPDEWAANVQPLLDWRATKGLETKLIKISEFAPNGVPTPAQTAEVIKAEYAKGNLTYVHLVGDGDKLAPPKGVREKADSDACWVKLEGDDHIPDAFISRFSANTAEQVDVQVARAISYEKNPVTGDDAAFYHKATGIASNEGDPTDFERANMLRDALMAWRFTEVDQIYDPGANVAKVAEAVNAGRGTINYIGHGSKTAWVTSRFAVNNVNQLTNGNGKWPMIWSVACVNGDFVRGSDCFGEAWAKAGTAANPYGAIGCVAASTNMAWVPPCDWQSAIMKDYMIGEVVFTGGALHLMGLVKACEQWGTAANSEGVRLIEQCIYFGDASVQIRNNKPQTATVSIESLGSRQLVKGARVVIKKDDSSEATTGVTDGDGLVSLPFAPTGDTEPEPTPTVKVTVTGPNLVPVLDNTLSLP